MPSWLRDANSPAAFLHDRSSATSVQTLPFFDALLFDCRCYWVACGGRAQSLVLCRPGSAPCPVQPFFRFSILHRNCSAILNVGCQASCGLIHFSVVQDILVSGWFFTQKCESRIVFVSHSHAPTHDVLSDVVVLALMQSQGETSLPHEQSQFS